LPLTTAAARSAGSKLDKRELAAIQVASNGARGVGKGEEARTLSANPVVLKIVDEELDAVWADRKPAKEALDNAVSRGNRALRAAGKSKISM
jgi:sn-glycerol 3-phosphate transport system substrate-binding protein